MNSPSKKIVIAGGTGFIGMSFARFAAEKGMEPILVARNEPRDCPFPFAAWDGRSAGEWARHLEGAAGVINLAGRTVDVIKTPASYDEILRSRVESVMAVGKALRQTSNPPPVWVQMSTAHIYGDPPKLWCDEDAAYGYGMAPIVGKQWEKAYHEQVLPGMRKMLLRTSFVIGKDGGALPRLKRITRFGLGGKVGDGKQGFSWIHELDMSRIIWEGLTNPAFTGPYICSAPNPVSNKVFMKELRHGLKVPFGLPAPKWLARLGAKLLFNTDPELAIYGRYVHSRRLREAGFEFEFPEIRAAMEDLCRP